MHECDKKGHARPLPKIKGDKIFWVCSRCQRVLYVTPAPGKK